MNLFEAKAIYDSKSGKFLEEFYINGNPVDCDEYYFYLEREKDAEDKKLKYKEKLEEKETVKENPYQYNDDDETCECDECKYKDKKKYESCDNDCKYMNCDECCNDFCEECEGCKVEEFDHGELLEIFTKRIQDTEGCPECIREILDEFADNFIEDYDEDEFEDNTYNECEDCDNKDICMDVSIIEEYFDKIENLNCDCDSCNKNVLYELFMLGKEIGWSNHKNYMKKLMGEALEE